MQPQLGCAVYIEDGAYNNYDNKLTILYYKYSGCSLRMYAKKIDGTDNEYELYLEEMHSNVTTTHLLSKETMYSSKWYYVQIGPDGTTIHTIKEDGSDDDYGIRSCGSSYTMYVYPGNTVYKKDSIGGTERAFFYGDGYTHGICISAIVANGPLIPDDIIARMLRPDLYSPYLEIEDTNNGVWDNSTYHTSINAVKGEMTFWMETEYYKALNKNASNIYVRVIKNHIESTAISEQVFSGFQAGDYSTKPLIKLEDYRQKTPLHIVFNELSAEDKVKTLSETFFTKHGTWGGYNGGCNGHLVYFNADGNLILEAHGDDYKPYGTQTDHPKGVLKETLTNNGTQLIAKQPSDQTGYGEDVFWDAFGWDQRTYKNYLRTGSSLVSNKYFGYGRFSVTMKIPHLERDQYDFGVCPALWYFHYIEVYPESDRYYLPPFDKRAEEGDLEMGYYKVLNNEIDIELPSHLTNGTTTSFTTLSESFFAEKYQTTIDYDHNTDLRPIDYNDLIIDSQTYIGMTSLASTLRFAGGRGSDPHSFINWTIANSATKTGTIDGRNDPTFGNCKFNSWLGEYNSGDGWHYSEDVYFNGSSDGDLKEDYQSLLTRVAKNRNGYADGQFHKWSIDWTPNRIVLLIDDVPVRVCYAYIPVNQMKYTAALWFPTLKRGIYNEDGVAK
uniref:Glycosyl hydrolases family 16 protein n=1 Tax=Dulem virus 42 TaxID=3145760 RepID=A0AAU8B7B4_9CAUD